MEERQILRAFLLMFLVVIVYYTLFPPVPPPRRDETAAVRPTPSQTAPGSTGTAETVARPAAPPTPVPSVAADREHRVDVETPTVEIGFKNRGARLVSWKLLLYRDAKGAPEEMVQTTANGPLPFDVETGEADVDARLKEALFKASTERLVLRAGEEGKLSFDFAEGDVVARKEFSFSGTGYLVGVTASVQRGGRELAKKVLWGPGIGHASEGEKKVQGFEEPGGVALVPSDGVARTPVAKLAEGVTYNQLRWFGVESRHFAALWVPPSSAGGDLRRVELPADPGGAARPATVSALNLGTATGPAQLYVGPKDYYALKGLGSELVRVVDVGDWIGPIVVFMMNVLRWLHGHLGNYGWAIVVLTVIISLIMAPIRHYGIANGRKMAKMAPELKVIQDRYRKMTALDPRRQDMHREMAAVYSRHGMSMGAQMAVGCLPILITMPFLFAVYKVLNVAIDLRGAGFLWIPDLSQSDPLFITPLLMGGSMFLMQKMTPTTMDPAQQKIMLYVMPLMFGFMMAALPAGLAFYILVNSLLTIVQQHFINRSVGPVEGSPSAREAAA